MTILLSNILGIWALVSNIRKRLYLSFMLEEIITFRNKIILAGQNYLNER